MTLLALVPVNLTQGGTAPTNLTTSLTALGSNTGVTFVNNGRIMLVVANGASAPTTVTSDIGTTIQGQTVPGVSSGVLAISTNYILGPYPLQYNRQDGTNIIELDFSSSTAVSVAAIFMPGVT